MALFTDAEIVTLDDLLLFENSLIQVSSTHGIDVGTKISLAVDEVGDKLLLALLRAGASGQWMGISGVNLSNVVVSSPVYRWVCFNSLARVYSEAYNVQLNTRFQGKWTEYQQQAQQAGDLVMASGIGISLKPLQKPSLPTITVGTGSLTASSLFVQATWVGSNNQESAPSPIAGTVLNGASAIQVTASSDSVPPNAASWNVYASTTQQGLQLQNRAPIAVGQVWTMPITGLVSGIVAGDGQTPDLILPLAKRIQRG